MASVSASSGLAKWRPLGVVLAWFSMLPALLIVAVANNLYVAGVAFILVAMGAWVSARPYLLRVWESRPDRFTLLLCAVAGALVAGLRELHGRSGSLDAIDALILLWLGVLWLLVTRMRMKHLKQDLMPSNPTVETDAQRNNARGSL